MSIFSTKSIHSMTNLGSIPTTDLSIHESMNAGSAAIIFESETNFTNMMKAIGIEEVNYYAQHGQVMVYEAGGIKGFIQKMIQFFKDLLKKIQALFNRFIAQIDAFVRSDKDFIKKYRAKLLLVDTKGFKYKGFKFTPDALTMAQAKDRTNSYLKSNNMDDSNIGKDTDTLRGYTKDWNDNTTDHTEALRGKVIGENKGKLTDKEFGEELFKLYRNGEDDKTDYDTIKVSEHISIIEGGAEAKKIAKKSMDDIKKEIDKVIADLKKQETKLQKFEKDESEDSIKQKGAAVAYVSALSNARKTQLQIINRANGALMSALKHQNRQAKSICVRLLGYLPKNESYRRNSSGSSLLEGVKFI